MVKDESSGRYHHGNLRQALIDAGMQALLGQTSLEVISLRELARQVGVSANAAYRHFASKEALLQAIAAAGFHDMAERSLAAQSSQPDAKRRLRAAGLNYVQYARSNPALFRLMFGRKPPNETSAELKEAAEQNFMGVRFAVSQASGLSMDDPHCMTLTLKAWVTVHGMAHLAFDGQFDHFSDDVDATINTLLDQFKPTLETPASSS